MAKPIFIMRVPSNYGSHIHQYEFGDLLRRMAVELKDYNFVWIVDGLSDQIVFETHNVDSASESDVKELMERLNMLSEHGLERLKAQIREEHQRWSASSGVFNTAIGSTAMGVSSKAYGNITGITYSPSSNQITTSVTDLATNLSTVKNNLSSWEKLKKYLNYYGKYK